MNSLISSCWSIWCCRIWMRALTLEPEYWLVLAGQMRGKLASSSSDTIGGPEEREKEGQEHVCCLYSSRLVQFELWHIRRRAEDKTPVWGEVISWPVASNTSSSSSSLLQPSDGGFWVFLQDWSKSLVTICFLGESGSRGETRPFLLFGRTGWNHARLSFLSLRLFHLKYSINKRLKYLRASARFCVEAVFSA